MFIFIHLNVGNQLTMNIYLRKKYKYGLNNESLLNL